MRRHGLLQPPLMERSVWVVVGPLARTAEDLELALGLIAGPDDVDGIGYRLTLPAPRHASLSEFRVLVIDTHPLMPTALAVRIALDRLVERLVRQGVYVARTSPLLPDLAEAARLHQKLVFAYQPSFRPARVLPSSRGPSRATLSRRSEPRRLATARRRHDAPRVDRGQLAAPRDCASSGERLFQGNGRRPLSASSNTGISARPTIRTRKADLSRLMARLIPDREPVRVAGPSPRPPACQRPSRRSTVATVRCRSAFRS